MKKIFTLTQTLNFCLLFFFSLNILNAQEERNIGEFTGVDAGSAFDISLTQGDKCNVKIEGIKPEDLNKIKTEVRDNVLYISLTNDVSLSEDAKIQITIKELTYLNASGAAEIKSTSEIKAGKINVNSSGAANTKLALNAEEINAKASSASTLRLTGKTKTLNADVSGASSLKSKELVAETVTVEVSGAGSAKVNVTQQLKAKASGAGNVNYTGDPLKKEIDYSGAGSVKPEGKGGSDKDTTYMRFGKKKVIIIEEKESHRSANETVTTDTIKITKKEKYKVKDIWQGIEFGFTGYMTKDNKAPVNFLELNYGKSWNFNINFCEHHLKLYKNYVALTTGLGLEFNRFWFTKKMALEPGADSLTGIFTRMDYKKNLLKSTYVTVPLLLEFNTNKKARKSFHLAFGIVGAYKLSSKTKQVFETNGKETEVKIYDDYNLNPFKVSATARLGYKRFNVFGTYGLTELFNDKADVDLIPFSVGLTLVPF